MKTRLKKVFSVFLVLILTLSAYTFSLNAYAVKNYTADELIKTAKGIISWKKADCGIDSKENLLSGRMLDNAGSTSCDWYVIGMSRLGIKDDYQAYLSVLKNDVESKYEKSGKLSPSKSTEWHRIALAVLSAGEDPTSFGKDSGSKSINLIADGVYNRGKTASLGKQGINGWIWGLITLDAMNYKIPSGAYYTRDEIISQIVEKQLADGGFALTGNMADPDITAMAVQALSTYYKSDSGVKKCVDKALSCLSKIQLDSGDYKCYASQNSESTAQVITALCSLGIDPQKDSRFIKNGNTLLDALMSYKASDGGFFHSKDYDQQNPSTQPGKSNTMAGEQALLAIAACVRQMKGQTKLYDFTGKKTAVQTTTKESVSSSDIKRIEEIISKPTTDNYAEVLKYIDLLNKSGNFSGRENYLNKLGEAKAKIEKAKQTIDEINEEVKENVSPADEKSEVDKSVIENIEEKIDSLDDADKEKIENSEDLQKAIARLDTKDRKVIIAVSLSCFIAVVTLLLVLRIVKKRKSKAAEIQISDDGD